MWAQWGKSIPPVEDGEFAFMILEVKEYIYFNDFMQWDAQKNIISANGLYRSHVVVVLFCWANLL